MRALYAACEAHNGGRLPPSCNMLLSRRFLQLVPRVTEWSGPVAVNSLGFAGTLLVRATEELEYIRRHGPMQILSEVGLPWDQ